MKRGASAMSRRYSTALQKYLRQDDQTDLASARALGGPYQASGMEMLDLARIHEQTLITHGLLDHPAERRDLLTRRSGLFFATVITPSERTDQSKAEVYVHRGRLIEMLSQRTVDLAVSNLERSLEIAQRKIIEVKLRKGEKQHEHLLRLSLRLRKHSRLLASRLLSAQEEERKKISHELHDVIAQTLMGINVHLAALKRGVIVNTKGIARNIAKTQRLVVRSVEIVHQFASRLRPAMLDDLGLVPALQAFMKDMAAKSGLRMHLAAYAGIETLDVNRRTTLFRVAQEALTNVMRHAEASAVHVTIENKQRELRMVIHDDGKAFLVDGAGEPDRKHLGIIGMRERMEMLNGRLLVDSAKGSGTTVTAVLPRRQSARPKPAKKKVAEIASGAT